MSMDKAEVMSRDTQTSQRGRDLGKDEMMYYHASSKYGALDYIMVTIVNSPVKITEEQFSETCRLLVRKQEILQMRVVSVKGKYSFRPMEHEIKDAVSMVTINENTEWVDIAYELDEKPLDHENGPLWNAVCASVKTPRSIDGGSIAIGTFQYVIIFKMLHSIVDGKSGLDLMSQQFLPILSAVVHEQSTEDLIQFVPICPPVEEYSNQLQPVLAEPWYKTLWSKVTSKIWELFWAVPERIDWRLQEDKKQPPLGGSACLPVVFTEVATRDLIKAAKDHGVTVNSVLLVANAAAISKTATDFKIDLPKGLSTAWTIDLRKYLKLPSPPPLGVFVNAGLCSFQKKHDYTKEEFWMLCKQVYEETKLHLEDLNATSAFGITRDVQECNFDSYIKGFGDITCCLSNLGYCHTGETHKRTDATEPISLQEHYFYVTGLTSMDSHPFLNMVGTINDRLMCNCAYNKNKNSRAVVSVYINHLQTILEMFCDAAR